MDVAQQQVANRGIFLVEPREFFDRLRQPSPTTCMNVRVGVVSVFSSTWAPFKPSRPTWPISMLSLSELVITDIQLGRDPGRRLVCRTTGQRDEVRCADRLHERC
jgi:hypothetical protein